MKISSSKKMTMQEPYDYYFSDKMMLTIKCLMFKLYLAGFKAVCANTVLKASISTKKNSIIGMTFSESDFHLGYGTKK